MKILDEGWHLLDALQDELAVPAARRPTGVPDNELQWAMDVIQQMLTALDLNALPPAEERYPILGYAITDHWCYTSTLAKELVAFERRYRQL